VRPYDDLRKTQAEVAEKQRAELLHKPSNAASLKVEAARQETPEAAPSQPADYIPQNPLRNMTTEQVVGFNRAAGTWNKEQGQQYLQAQAGRGHNDQLVSNQKQTEHARAFVQEARAQEMSPSEVTQLYEQHGMKREAEAFERQQQNYAHGHDDEGGEQHRLEQAWAALKVEASAELRKAQQAQGLEARVDAFRANPARQQTAPEATKAPEQPERPPQGQPCVAVATMDGSMVGQQREAMQRVRGPTRPEPQTAPEAAKASEKSEQPQRPARAAPDVGKRKLGFYEDLNAPTREHQIKR